MLIFFVPTVAGPPNNVTTVQVPSHSPTLNISWNMPQEGAVITGYTVHYSGADRNGNQHNGSSNTTTDTTVLIHDLRADGRTYNLKVEAHSEHFSGYSEPLHYEPCKLTLVVHPNKVVVTLIIMLQLYHIYTLL